MNSQIVSWINKKFGYNISSDYYAHIDKWLDWWRGYCKPFHHYIHNNGKQLQERDLYTLKMGKKICEDWASILLNSKTKIVISDKKTNDFIQGSKETSGVLGGNAFWVQANRLIERAFATGTGAITIHIDNVNVFDDTVQPSEAAQIRLNYISADYIIPLTCSNGRITEAAFASEQIDEGKRYLIIEMHKHDWQKNYIINNYRFDITDGSFNEAELPHGLAKTVSTGTNIPWFAIYEPNIENPIENNNGLGVSIIHSTMDALKAVDIIFNNFCSDYYLGSKKVFMNKDLIDLDDDGNDVVPDDVNQQLFTWIPKGITDVEGHTQFIYEFNPVLRTEENTKGVQAALDYLSFKAGLGNKHYQFNSGSIVTATQYTGDKQDLIQNAHKHYIVVEEFLLQLIKSIIHIGRNIIGADLNENADIEIVFDKSVIIDEAAERLQDAQDVRDGFMSKWEYRMKWYGESEGEAKAIISEIAGMQSEDEMMGFGDGG